MKNLLTVLLLTITLFATAQQKITVKQITPTYWVIKIPHTQTVTHNNKTSGAVLGGTVGYFLGGGLTHIIGGALLGSQMADEPTYETTTYYTEQKVNGYLLLLSTGQTYRTCTLYKVGQLIDPNTIVQQ